MNSGFGLLRLFRVKLFSLAMLFLVGSTLFNVSLAFAEDEFIEEQPRVIIESWLEPNGQAFVSQQMNLYIEVSTESWFASGTRIGNLEVDGAVVLRREQFAVNSSRRVEGKQWTTQQWMLTLYPQRAGNFFVPVVTVDVTVTDLAQQPLSLSLTTKPLSFVASYPENLDKRVDFIAAPTFQVTQTFDKELSNVGIQLSVGDSLNRTITINASNMAAMMLPEVTFSAEEGLAAYQQSAVVNDKVNRGDYLAERIESVTYVVEEEGSYYLPALSFLWWNLSSNSLQKITLPAILVATDSLPDKMILSEETQQELDESNWSNGFVLMGVLLLLFTCVYISRNSNFCNQLRTQYVHKNKLDKLHKHYKSACQNRDFQRASILFFEWCELKGIPAETESIRVYLQYDKDLLIGFNVLMAQAYSSKDVIKIEKTSQLEQLLSNIKQQVEMKNKISAKSNFKIN